MEATIGPARVVMLESPEGRVGPAGPVGRANAVPEAPRRHLGPPSDAAGRARDGRRQRVLAWTGHARRRILRPVIGQRDRGSLPSARSESWCFNGVIGGR